MVTDRRSLVKSRKLGAELWPDLEKKVSGKYDNYVDKRRLALKNSKLALDAGGSWFLAGQVQYIKALIALKKFDLAREGISKLDINWRNQKNDVKTALRCGLAAAESDFQTGYRLVNQFSVQSSHQAKGYKKKFCAALVKDISISYEKRLQYQSELD